MKPLLACLLLVGCARAPGGEAPIESVARFDGELGAAKERRRVVALASPT
ncbi:MAG TPA: hypothetical protein VGL86_01305 [Polyangia bacterium]|jgi:hypothetical protein